MESGWERNHKIDTTFILGGAMKSKRESGAAAVEFALVLPFFLLVFSMIVDLSLAFYDKAVITNASREAARAGVVLR
ncbi:pilus assembly protein, partial [Mycobacterium tuberculosis]